MRIQRLSDDAIAMQLGDALRERRLRRSITQQALADLVGVSVPTIQKLEKGRGALQLLIAVLRELNGLDLLSHLTAVPRVSPLEVARTGKVARIRAPSGTPSGRVAPVKRSVEPELDEQSAKRGNGPLLIPRR